MYSTARERRARRIYVMHELERAIASERERAEVYPVYDHYQMYMYHRHKQGKAQIVHMGNTKISQLVYRLKTFNCHYRNLRVEYYQYTYSLVQELIFF